MNSSDSSPSSFDRRSFLRQAPAAGALLAAGSSIPATAMAGRSAGGGGYRKKRRPNPSPAQVRRTAAYNKRLAAAIAQRNLPLPAHPSNADESSYPNYIGNFSKALPHDANGEVDPSAYRKLLAAVTSGAESDFAAIPLGGTAKLANPQAALAFSLEGPDSHHLAIAEAPALASAWAAGEMVEVYWRAWTRDVPFSDYGMSPAIAAAASDLSSLPDYRGPEVGGDVTPETIFRGTTDGNLVGPFLSQFLWLEVPYGATTIPQRYRTTAENDNHLTAFADWLQVRNGGSPVSSATSDGPYYIASGRDLAEFVHYDFSYQAYLNAGLILLSFGGNAFDENNPYRSISNQGAFISFGGAHLLDLVARAAREALKAAWFQKWRVHRRLRPEDYGGLVHRVIADAADYPLHSSILDSAVLPLIQGAYSTSLLPLAYPEGCPTHPAYPAGHATIAGACVTVLKAFFDESFEIPNPVEANALGDTLLPYGGSLTVGGELNKLAANISHGRDTAGVHWRTDGEQGMRLGEEVAIRLLRDHKTLTNETFAGFSLTKFDGSTITV
ncbi:MAG: vanadium-dependent haloperoxidase [Verrucomicrobiae bacterium]|nr:vanadium-dependent haloperoxidase [Verrucomicrobiae bacterium]